jgi:hypothetical protein
MRTARIALAALGLCAGVWGILLISEARGDQISQVLTWAALAVGVHDALLAPSAVGVGWIVNARLRPGAAAVAAWFLLIGGTLTLLAVPVLLRGGSVGKNPTLLDRNYFDGWLTLMAAVLMGVLACRLVVGTISRRSSHGAGHGRR